MDTPFKLCAVIALAMALIWPVAAQAQNARADAADIESVRETTHKLIELLIQSGILTKEKAQAILEESERQARASRGGAKARSGTVRVPYVPKSVRDDISREVRDQVKKELAIQAAEEGWGTPNAVPAWLDRLRFEGGLRVRYQHDAFDAFNAPAAFFRASGAEIDNTTTSRSRMRLRARLGLTAVLSPEWSAGLRLTTGSTRDAVSTNQTLGQYGNNYAVVMDRAYLRYEPGPRVTVWAGRMLNPWFRSDLVWDEDLHFEGVAINGRLGKPGATFKPYATLGAFSLQEVELSGRDKYLLGAQAGVDWEPSSTHQLRLGLALYDYRNVEGRRNSVPGATDTDYTAPGFRQFGNTLFNLDPGGDTLYGLAAKFRNANLTLAWNYHRFDPIVVSVMADYVRNLAFDQGEIRQRTGLTVDQQDSGHQLRVQVGHPRLQEARQWQAYIAYKHLEADAVLDAFTDSDFHLGGTNAKGFIIGGAVGLGPRTALGLRWLSANEITGAPFKVDVFQLDLSTEF